MQGQPAGAAPTQPAPAERAPIQAPLAQPAPAERAPIQAPLAQSAPTQAASAQGAPAQAAGFLGDQGQDRPTTYGEPAGQPIAYGRSAAQDHDTTQVQPTTSYPAEPLDDAEQTRRITYAGPSAETRWNPTDGPLPRRVPQPSADQPEIIDGEIVESDQVVETTAEPDLSPRRDEPPVDAEVIAEVLPEPTPQPEPTAQQDKPKPMPISPANSVEESLLEAAEAGSTDRFLSTLLLARILIPGWDGDGPLDATEWATNDVPGGLHLVVFTSHERMAERVGPDVRGSWIKFTKLIRSWPGPSVAFAVNPESQIGATLPGDEVVQLANWAAESGLGADDPEDVAGEPQPAEEPAPRPTFEPQAQTGPIMMQKPITPEQLSYYLERGYDRVSGFVHRAGEVAHLKAPGQLYLALGLNYAGSSFDPTATEAYVLRWRAYRANLYRIPYGGQHEAAMRAMEGWVIERPPFRGNGFAPSETSDVIAEFKVDSARLPHNAQIWRLHGEGEEELVAVLDADGPRWRPAGES